MVKFLLLIVVSLVGCTSSHHIRRSNYYEHDWSLIGVASNRTPSEPYQHHPIFAEIKDSKEGKADFSKTLDYFIYGVFPGRYTMKMSEICGEKALRQAYISHSFAQAVMSLFTFGIYTPRTLEVWCD